MAPIGVRYSLQPTPETCHATPTAVPMTSSAASARKRSENRGADTLLTPGVFAAPAGQSSADAGIPDNSRKILGFASFGDGAKPQESRGGMVPGGTPAPSALRR